MALRNSASEPYPPLPLPDRPNFKSYSHITALQPVGTVPGPFRPTFGLPGQPAGQPVG